jgi:hypothetical protein
MVVSLSVAIAAAAPEGTRLDRRRSEFGTFGCFGRLHSLG